MNNKDSLDGKDIDELLKLKNEINEKIEFLNENASSKTINKVNKHKSKIKNRTNFSDNIKDDFSHMNTRQQKKTIKRLNFFNKGLNIFNKFIKAFQSDVDIDPGRLMALSDGIFSIVMTLLIFGMTLPEMELLTAGDFLAFIQSMLPNIGVTLVSFILLASFWIYHHQFFKLKSLNMPLLWLNILVLASLSFIPFTTTIIGTYSKFFLANFLFGLNILLILVLFILMFKYADKMNFLKSELTADERKYTYHTFYMIMGLTVAVNLLDFNVSPNFIYLFFLVPIISIIRDTRFKLKHVEL